MAQNVINSNIDREFALQAMHRLHSCYLHVMEILRTNKALCFERPCWLFRNWFVRDCILKNRLITFRVLKPPSSSQYARPTQASHRLLSLYSNVSTNSVLLPSKSVEMRSRSLLNHTLNSAKNCRQCIGSCPPAKQFKRPFARPWVRSMNRLNRSRLPSEQCLKNEINSRSILILPSGCARWWGIDIWKETSFLQNGSIILDSYLR